MPHEIFMYFRIMEFALSPDDIVDKLELTNVNIWRKGDVMNSRTGKLYEYHGIEIASGVEKEKDFDAHVAALMSVIEPRLPTFIEVCSSSYTELSCALYLYHDSEESTPAVHFDKSVQRVLAALGAEIDIDLYAL